MVQRRSFVDYMLIYYSGHGYGKNGQTIIGLNEFEDINVNSLPSNAPTQLIIIDSCRKNSLQINEAIDRLQQNQIRKIAFARKIYDDCINSCPKETTFCFACSYDDISYSNNYCGGYFTDSLINESLSWSVSKQESQILTLQDACKLSFNKLRLFYFKDQHPTIVSKTHGCNLPFCVNLSS